MCAHEWSLDEWVAWLASAVTAPCMKTEILKTSMHMKLRQLRLIPMHDGIAVNSAPALTIQARRIQKKEV